MYSSVRCTVFCLIQALNLLTMNKDRLVHPTVHRGGKEAREMECHTIGFG